jgi:hypothetical protein
MTIETKTSSHDTQLFDNSQVFTFPTIQNTIETKLCRRVVDAGSSRRVQDGIDKVVSCPAAML